MLSLPDVCESVDGFRMPHAHEIDTISTWSSSQGGKIYSHPDPLGAVRDAVQVHRQPAQVRRPREALALAVVAQRPSVAGHPAAVFVLVLSSQQLNTRIGDGQGQWSAVGLNVYRQGEDSYPQASRP